MTLAEETFGKRLKDLDAEERRAYKRTVLRRWKERHPERPAELARRWRGRNPGRAAEAQQRWRDSDPGRATDVDRRWERKNPGRGAELRTCYRQRINALVTAEKGTRGRCESCGQTLADLGPRELHFHHRDPATKRFRVSNWQKEFRVRPGETQEQAVLAEMAKCDLVCRSCHSEIHRSPTGPPDAE